MEFVLAPRRRDVPISTFPMSCCSLLLDQPAGVKRACSKNAGCLFKQGRSMQLHEDAAMCVEKFILLPTKEVGS